MYILEKQFKNQKEALEFTINKYLETVKVLDCTAVGKVVYVLCEVIPTTWMNSFRYIAILHFSTIKGVWTCNEYDESMNPSQFLDCPIKYFDFTDLHTDQAKQWKATCLSYKKKKNDRKKSLQTKISILEEKFRSQHSCVVSSAKHGKITIISFHSNSKSQIIGRNEDGALFRYKLIDFSLEEISKI